MENSSYISCIKIKGVPILPPLITPDRRRELQEFKNQALCLEDLYHNRKLNKQKKDNFENSQSKDSNIDQVLKDINSPLKYVPYVTEKKLQNLSKDLIDVSEYSSALNIFSTNNETTTSGVELDELFSYEDEDSKNKSETSFSNDGSKPRLIRSNSYTLDNPSPLLIAHLKRQNSLSSSSDYQNDTVPDRLSLENDSIKPTTLNFKDSSIISLEKEVSTIEDISHQFHQSFSDPSLIEPAANNQKSLQNLPIVEVVTTDITVQQINITTSIDDNIDNRDLLEIMNNNDKNNRINNEEISNKDPENELKLILQELPDVYSKKILKLLERQKMEENKRKESYEQIKQHLLQSGDHNEITKIAEPIRILVTEATPDRKEDKVLESVGPTTLSLNGSQTLSFDTSTSCSESLDDESLRTVTIIDLEKVNSEINKNEKISVIKSTVLDERAIRKAREEKAANTIVAYAKGYLVRRLMKTSKVQTLIYTIQEALICALEMQTSDNIEEADVELHRRLIQQISAACYEFHDVFFSLTPAERMDLIAIDREKRRRKNFAIRTTRSSADFSTKRRSNPNSYVRMTKSLTKF